jgi:adenylate cyclase
VTAIAACRTCGTEPLENARFCHGCGSPVAEPDTPAEYKQVTVLFADVVHSMDIAAAVGAERLREIMAELLDRSTAVVKRYGGTVDKFTGDGVMAVFGAPVALEDHAVRACLAAVGIQEETESLAAQVHRKDGVSLRLRIGLNSGEVIAGEIGSGTATYTTIGEQVGMAQRMESAAPQGGVMLGESTVRLVEDTAVLGEPQLVHVKGADDPVPGRRLLAIGDHQPGRRGESALVGRTWEMNAITGILEEAIAGSGFVVGVSGPAGIGKSRLVRESTKLANSRGVPVFTAFCESHTRDVPFHVVARLLRAGRGSNVRDRYPNADADDLLLLEDLMGRRDSAMPLPEIAPDARRRRLTALVNAAALASTEPVVYVIEDVHWIDDASESMLADFLAVIPRTPVLVLITYRPEYRGALTRVPGAQTLALRPLSDAHSSALTAELLGADPSLRELAVEVAARAAGNPFFAEEMVRDLAERGVLRGQPGAYRLEGDAADKTVPATLQAAIGARIDRLGATTKKALNAAAVIGTRFDTDLLTSLIGAADVVPLIEAELIDQVSFSSHAEYAFRHPLIRTVAYESQLKSDRQQLHLRLAAAIEHSDENAALIAEHLEAAGDLYAAFEWHMRAGTWSKFRDIAAAHTSWRRARQVADRLPEGDADRMSMRIAPRSLLCGSAFYVTGTSIDAEFEELRELCTLAGDQRSLAIGLAGLVTAYLVAAHRREASGPATELVRLLESINDPTMTIGLTFAAIAAKQETGEVADVLPLAQHVIDLADGRPTEGNLIVGSPLGMAIAARGMARACMGVAGWKDDFAQAFAMARPFHPDPITFAGVMWNAQIFAVSSGMLLPDAALLRNAAEFLLMAEQSGDDLMVDMARTARGLSLSYGDGRERHDCLDLLARVCKTRRFANVALVADIVTAMEKSRLGDLDEAIELARTVFDQLFASGQSIWSALTAAAVVVEALLRRGSDADLNEARAAVEKLAALPIDPGYVLQEIWLLRLRALLAQADRDDAAYRDYRDRYRAMANSLGFEGHIAWAEAMP